MLDLPAPPRYRMADAPLVQALVQVNFPLVPQLQTLDGAAAVQAALAPRFPYLGQSVVQQMSLMVGPAGPAAPQTAQSVVHELSGDDGWTLTITVSSATLSVDSGYTGIDDFAGRFREVCAALAGPGGAARCDRLGVRYLDLVEAGEGTDGWHDWFRPELVGVADPALSGQSLLSTLTETRLRQDPEGPFEALQDPVDAVLRHGVVPGGSLLVGVPPRPVEQRAFVFDMDAAVAAHQPLDPDTLAAQFRALHAEIEKVFHWAVTDAGKARFGYEELGEQTR